MVKKILRGDKIEVKLFRRLRWLFFGILFLNLIIWARPFDLAIEDSLRRLPPNLEYYHRQKEEDCKPFVLESLNVRMVGKWGRGPSGKVTGRGNLLFLSLGSEVAILDISNPSGPRVVVFGDIVPTNEVLTKQIYFIQNYRRQTKKLIILYVHFGKSHLPRG